MLNLTYLMSTSLPYQVQLMETAVRLPIPVPCPLLLYNDHGETGSTATVDGRGVYRDKDLQITLSSGPRGWTHVIGTPGGGVLFYCVEDEAPLRQLLTAMEHFPASRS